MHKVSGLRDDDAKLARGEASLGVPQRPGRRQVLTLKAMYVTRIRKRGQRNRL